MLKSCLRAVDALATVPGVDTVPSFQDFLKRNVQQNQAVNQLYIQIQAERAEAEGPRRVDRMEI